MKIAILGTSGMLGNKVLKVFSETTDYEIVATCRNKKHFKDIPNIEWQILDARNSSYEEMGQLFKDCKYIINCIGIIKTEIDEKNPQDIQKAIEVNALFPHKLNKVAQKINAKIIQIATDCVYDGKTGNYTEDSEHNALDVYGKTKSLGEVKSDKFINLRCSIIGPEIKSKNSLLEWFLNQQKNATVKGFQNHLWNGITTYQFAKICIGIIENSTEIGNLQHVIPSDIVTKEQMLRGFQEVFDRPDITIQAFNTEVAINRAISTNNTDINQLLWENAGYSIIPSYAKMLGELKKSH